MSPPKNKFLATALICSKGYSGKKYCETIYYNENNLNLPDIFNSSRLLGSFGWFLLPQLFLQCLLVEYTL